MFFIVLYSVLILALLGIIHYLSKRKVLAAVPFIIMFLGFATILVSIFFPGGFEGMAIGFLGLIIGIIGLIWLILYMIVKSSLLNVQTNNRRGRPRNLSEFEILTFHR